MHRFYLPPQAEGEGELTLDERESHHAATVLRIHKGDRVAVLDGNGTEYMCEVIVVDKKATRLVSTAVKQDRSVAVFYHFITGYDKRAIDGFRNPRSHRTTRAPHCAIGCREIGGVG